MKMKIRTFPIVFTIGFILALGLALVFIPKHKKEIKNLRNYADTHIGTGGHGHTFPGATLPFGMVQISPDTRLTGWDACSAYHFSDSVIHGFSHTHLSGTGVSDYGDILFMPMSGTSAYHNSTDGEGMGYSSRFSHNSEITKPGFYSVHLIDPDIDAQFTCTKRTAYHKYKFNQDKKPFIIIDLKHRDKVIESGIKKVNKTDIAGYRRSDAWAKDQHVYFYASFSEPIKSFEIKSKEVQSIEDWEFAAKNLKAGIGFDMPENKEIIVKIGISPVSADGAKNNFLKEAGGTDFITAREIAASTWNDELSDIIVSGKSEKDKIKFYSALYHSYLAPNIFSDYDGKYRGTDLKVHQSENHNQYTVFSLWDTYRATHPLFTITQQERTKDFIQTFIRHYKEGGQLPVWELAGNYTGCMIGYHSIPVIYDAYQKGIYTENSELLLEAMINSAKEPHLGLPAYMDKGFIGIEDEHESVSKTLEYAYDDWCIAQMAKEMGENDIYNEFIKRAQSYKNLFDPSTKMMRARQNGGWYKPFDPGEVNFNYTEANAWQYSFYIPQDIEGWTELLGGKKELEKMLDSLFSADNKTTGRNQVDITGLIGQYAHGNEPSHHIAYLYNYCGKPWKTQKLVKKIMNEFYTTKPDGYIGNEDCGQMSAWYVLSSMGLYPVNPANGIYDIGSPVFDTAKIQLENSKTFLITAENLSDKNIYVQSLELNGEKYKKMYIRHEDIMKGGELHFVMGHEPATDIGTSEDAIYKNKISDNQITIAPYFDYEASSFYDSAKVEIKSTEKDSEIYYSTDDSKPDKKYEKPFYISQSKTVKAQSIKNENKSGIIKADFKKLDKDLKIDIKSEYNPQYTAGGDIGLIDGIRGGKDFRNGLWQGYQGKDFEAIVDLGSLRKISSVGAGFLQDIRSWIWMPQKIEIYTGKTKNNMKLKATLKPDAGIDDYGVNTEDLTTEFEPENIRYIKIIAKQYGEIPEWHLGAGGQSFIFIDEIIFE